MRKKIIISSFIVGALALTLVALDMPGTAQSRGGNGDCPGYHQGYGRGPHFGKRGGSGRKGGFGHWGLSRLNHLQYRLGLTDEQVKKVFDIGSKYREEAFKVRKDQPALIKLHEKHLKEIEGVLNSDQKKIWQEMMERRNYRRGPAR